MGHTPLPSRPSTPSVVHPHARGAYQLKWRFWTPYNGSSPPTWGIRCSTAPTIDISRFIPTYVGHTAFGPQNAPAGSVHPHTRGAYTGSSRNVNSKIGSSPPTWGIHRGHTRAVDNVRFIPTYVGHTPAAPSTSRGCPVHPHIRGAYVMRHVHPGTKAGSSPHTWGIPCKIISSLYKIWFIPTYVGHTDARASCCGAGAVHPHIRGAYVTRLGLLNPLCGSSPHTWGIHWTAVRKMAGFSHFSYDFIRKSYFVQGLVFFGVIGAEASPTHRRGRSQCLPGAHGGSVRNL